MSTKYKATETDTAYFITMTTVGWVDVFTRLNQKYKVWQNGYHAEKVYSNKFIKQKINYIHNNPVAEKIVEKPEDYIFSSARNYAELNSELDVIPVWIF